MIIKPTSRFEFMGFGFQNGIDEQYVLLGELVGEDLWSRLKKTIKCISFMDKTICLQLHTRKIIVEATQQLYVDYIKNKEDASNNDKHMKYIANTLLPINYALTSTAIPVPFKDEHEKEHTIPLRFFDGGHWDNMAIVGLLRAMCKKETGEITFACAGKQQYSW